MPVKLRAPCSRMKITESNLPNLETFDKRFPANLHPGSASAKSNYIANIGHLILPRYSSSFAESYGFLLDITRVVMTGFSRFKLAV